MVQPSYPRTVELKHSRFHSKEDFDSNGKPLESEDVSVSILAPSGAADPQSHANDLASGQAERLDTKPVNPGSSVRIEEEAGPGEPH